MRPTFLIAATLAAIVAASQAVAAERSRPNIVLFLADDLSWSDCSLYGRAGIRTPNMERLAAAGRTFTHAFVASPSCAPSRGALLTGLSPTRSGAMFNHTVPDAAHTRWPAYFRELGYEVVAFGKVDHYATVRQYGFDHASHFNYHQDDCIEAAVNFEGFGGVQPPIHPLVAKALGLDWAGPDRRWLWYGQQWTFFEYIERYIGYDVDW